MNDSMKMAAWQLTALGDIINRTTTQAELGFP
jgi:hypothetical protein